MSFAYSNRSAGHSSPEPASRPPARAPFNPVWRRLAMSPGSAPASRPTREPGAGLRRAPVDGAEAAQREADELAPKLGSLVGGGAPLAARQRDYFEPRLGRDLGHVRIHDDAQASHAARTVGARAFTAGSDIVFGAGQYAPHSAAGKHLLAHELTHVLQQTSASEPRAGEAGPGAPQGATDRSPRAGTEAARSPATRPASPRTTPLGKPPGTHVARNGSCNRCTVCGSGTRYRVNIAALDAFQVGTPYADMELHARTFLNSNSLRQSAHLTAPQRSDSGPFTYTNTPAPGMPARMFTAGNFYLFADWDICETASNPCRLRQSETITVTRTGQAPRVTTHAAVTPSLGNSWTKAPRRNAIGNCDKTLVWIDGPGDIAVTGGSSTSGFVERVDQTLEVIDGGTGAVVDTKRESIGIAVDSAGNLTATP